MARFDDCLTFVLASEGGFVNNPDDPGGATNQGITQKVYDAWRTKRTWPEKDIKAIGQDEVWAIYHENYWVPAGCDSLPAPLDLLHFDSAVNLGVGSAGRMLQTALNFTVVDGVVGPRTLKAANSNDLGTTYGRYCNARIMRYIALSKPEFLKGWLRRVGRLLAAL